MEDVRYVRFHAKTPNGRGSYPGVFGLVNGLSRTGRLTEVQERFRETNNAWYNANYTDPTTVDPSVYDREANPGAAAWFKPSAAQLIERVTGYLEILDAHGVGWVRAESTDPGRIIYEDAEQIVVVPHAPAAG
ncbi:hypothetical protein F0L68_30975 [Solihabitans fulvus]|uniref:Uncharacterized protein n=1 Tax=Solihabitans fulvus TaxID=1892852 RepID=A0A5B2WUE1_9PSEU|nr:hypothetical protein [Solihabitans fulvus]KAA2254039.1 hypothetical protein F0L68_30975 [Solihabitans fulvus]